MSLCSFSSVEGPRQAGSCTRDMNGAFMSAGTGRGERERRWHSMSVAQFTRELLYSVTAFWREKERERERERGGILVPWCPPIGHSIVPKLTKRTLGLYLYSVIIELRIPGQHCTM